MKRNPVPNHFPLAMLFPALALVTSTHAATLLTDDFESRSLGALAQTSPWTTVSLITSATATVTNSGTPFGSSTKYLSLSDPSDAAPTQTSSIRIQSGNITEAYNTLTTLKFDFYEPAGGASVLRFGYALASSDLNGTGSRINLTLDDGTISGTGFTSSGNNTYSLTTAYTIYVIFNDTASGINYGGGTVAAGSADVWFEVLGNGAQTFAGTALVQNSLTPTTSYRVGFRTFTGDVQDMYIDNVSLFEGAAAIVPVPEPGAALLGGLGLLALLRRRRD
jgi:MYXO-CTERM domain-containing protein